MHRILLALMLGAAPSAAFAYQLPPITNDKVKQECSACHMAFQPQMLPARSWQAIMSDLGNHFGENASIADAAVAQEITDYLVQNAGDADGTPRGLIKRLPPDQTPLRITELPRWIGAHSEEVGASAWKKAGSKANCVACHRGAADGYYGDD